MPKRPNIIPVIALSLLLIAGVMVLVAQDGTDAPTDNLDYWLDQSTDATDTSAIDSPPGDEANLPAWALPVVVESGTGELATGWAYRDFAKAITVYETAAERYRRIPLAACLSITSTLDARMENEWLWSEMGSNEKIYTGEQYPLADVTWTFLLADGGEIVGTVKGQVIHFAPDTGAPQRLVLPVKVRGETGQMLDDLECVSQIVISRRARDERLIPSEDAENVNSGDSDEEKPD
jgi:hypothetical protein